MLRITEAVIIGVILTSADTKAAIIVRVMAGSITTPAPVTTKADTMATEGILVSVTSTGVMQVTATTGMVALTGMAATIAEPAIAVNRAFWTPVARGDEVLSDGA